MNNEYIGIIVMLNNYFHDLAVAILFSSIFTAWLIWKRWGEGPFAFGFIKDLVGDLDRVAKLSLTWIFLGGIIRALAYRDYEWMSAAGNGQVLALIIKHFVLVATVVAGIALLIDLRKKTRNI